MERAFAEIREARPNCNLTAEYRRLRNITDELLNTYQARLAIVGIARALMDRGSISGEEAERFYHGR